MGWTGVNGMSSKDLISMEMRGTEILASSGTWRLYRLSNGEVGLVHFLTARYGGETMVKPVNIEMGGGVVPPASMARRYVEMHGGDIEAAGGAYGVEDLRRALEPKPKAPVKGDRVHLVADEGRIWADGVPIAGDYTYLGKFRARRVCDGGLVRLPRSWRRDYGAQVVEGG